MYLRPNKKYPNIFNLKYQTKDIATEDLWILCGLPKESNDEFMHKADNLNSDSIDKDSITNQVKEKYTRLTKKQKAKIIYLFHTEKQSRAKISEELIIPYTTVWRVVRESYQLEWGSKSEMGRIFERNSMSRNDTKYAVKYISECRTPFTSRDVRIYLRTTKGTHPSAAKFFNLWKKDLNFLRKRVSSRPVIKETLRKEAWRKYFDMSFQRFKVHLQCMLVEQLCTRSYASDKPSFNSSCTASSITRTDLVWIWTVLVRKRIRLVHSVYGRAN